LIFWFFFLQNTDRLSDFIIFSNSSRVNSGMLFFKTGAAGTFCLRSECRIFFLKIMLYPLILWDSNWKTGEKLY